MAKKIEMRVARIESSRAQRLGRRTMKQTRVADVKKPLEPMFMLFDFRAFSGQVYEEIVRNFENGRIV
jgi:hypothetical protein